MGRFGDTLRRCPVSMPSGTRGRDASAIPSAGLWKRGVDLEFSLVLCCCSGVVPRGTLWRYHRTHRSFGSVKSGHSEGCSCILGTHVRCALGSGAMKRSRRQAFLNAPLPVRLFANGASTTTTRDGGAPIRQRRSAADADTGSASSARACSTPSTHGPHLHEGFACPIDILVVKHPTANTTAGDRAHEPCGVSPSTAMRYERAQVSSHRSHHRSRPS